MTFYTFAKIVVKGIFKPIYRIEAIGVENIPKEGSVLLCANHISNLDPVALGITCPRPVIYMAKEELFRVPILKGIIKKLYAFPVKRGKADREALRKGLETLKSERILGIFPEGTRSKTGEIGKGLAGAGFFALKSDATVVPAAIIGPYRPFRKVKVVYGKPIDMKPLKEKRASSNEAIELIMDHIKEILLQYK
ncbi:lysophospholipid acyltransferase family protein [Fervidibacillus halotolerans]|uniref:1-acyl-sn-glycerol-3-phosphate acyltransferase n=1 Tax=Fervidibacillus halotolerans TaxID=2980027 RepID=A0A9E8M1Z2_9BACI|nr:lysophospholipid acyltransferase family protein [Fervidibacillus halotolerans]WAA13774.1 1-acyl-sn-glycerol-3-phosphate acyltransferase [Fervidibacillus halotolerans]